MIQAFLYGLRREVFSQTTSPPTRNPTQSRTSGMAVRRPDLDPIAPEVEGGAVHGEMDLRGPI